MSVKVSAPSEWQIICRVEDIPSSGGRVVHVGATEISLFRLRHGAILAVENRCPHKGGKLSEGIVADHTVICPLHGWRIDLVTGEAVRPDKGCVRRFAVDVREGEVRIFVPSLQEESELMPLCDAMGSHPDNGRPKLGRRRATAEDFSVQDFDRDVPVLAVEPPSPEDPQSLRLSITEVGKDSPAAELSIEELSRNFAVVDLPAHVTCLMYGFTRPVAWRGVRLADVLTGLGLAKYPFGSFFSWDTAQTPEGERFFETLPREYMLDPRALLVFGMNGAPLPKEHGGPLRLALPFLQGYKSVKWLTWIKMCTEDEVGYKKKHGFIFFPELGTPPGYRP